MAGTIAADTLTHSTAGSLTTDFVVNGSAKHWANVDQEGTMSTLDSFNQSSISDLGTGRTQCNINNNMNNDDYCVNVGFGRDQTNYFDRVALIYTPNSQTGQFEIWAGHSGFDYNDQSGVFPTVHGDLA